MSHHHHTAVYAPSNAHAWGHASIPYHAAPMFGGGGIGHMIMSSVVHFAMWRILGSLFRGLGPFGLAFCVLLLIGAWFLSRQRRSY